MKNFLLKIKDIFNRGKSSKVSYAKNGIDPKKDWSNLLLFIIIFFFSVSIFSYYIYFLIDRGTFVKIPEEVTKKDVSIDTILLNKLYEGINTREASSTELKSGNVKIPADPSI
jgi:hypothetical protein